MTSAAAAAIDAGRDVAPAVLAIESIEAVPTILDVVCRTTGMGFAAVARVTEDRWIACSVRDDIAFGLRPGGELKVETTICHEIRQAGTAVAIDHVAEEAAYCGHPTPALYGFQSYISMPIVLPDGTFFGTLCAIDREPAKVNTPEIIGMFKMFAEMIAFHLDAHQRVSVSTGNHDRIWKFSRDMLLVADHDGVWISVNPAWTRVLGWSDSDLVGRTFAWLVHPDDRGKTLAGVVGRPTGETSLMLENRLRTKAGDYRHLSWNVTLEGGLFYCSARDVTVETERAKALLIHETIIQSSLAPICAFDTECRLIAFNQAHNDEFFRVNGFTTKLGDVFPDLFVPEQAVTMRALMTRALAGESFIVVEEFGKPELGTPHWEISYTPMRNEAGAIIGAFHHAMDISARLRAEAELAHAQDALRQAQKMEAVGQLTGGVAHDFNNLLTVIRSSVDLLARPDLPAERSRRYIAAISDTVTRAAKLTGQLLAFARRQALKPEVFDVGQAISTLGEMIATLTGPRIAVAAEIPERSWFANADPSQFDTALVNMAVNARDAMSGEGRLTIGVHPVTEIPPLRTHPARPGDFLAVRIADTGSGMPPEQLEQIFEPFFTTKGVGQGTGLGLSQVFGFAKQSGGDIHVESVVGRGTTFTLYLPRVAAEPHLAGPEPEPEALVDGHGTRVLVVEDNVAVGTFATQTLSELGYETVWAADAQEALVMLAERGAQVDVVFSDVVMPGMNGIDLAQEIRHRHGDLPVVLTSGYSHVLAQNGTCGFELLHKPYSVEQLSRILRKAAMGQRRKRQAG